MTDDTTVVVHTPRETFNNLSRWFKENHPGDQEEWLKAMNMVLWQHKRQSDYVATRAANAVERMRTLSDDRKREEMYQAFSVYVSRALYEAIYDDAERYKTSLREITIWRLRIATGLSRPSSVPMPPVRMTHKLRPRINGRGGRTIELIWPMTVQHKIREVTVDIAKESGIPRLENYQEIARDMLYQQYNLKPE